MTFTDYYMSFSYGVANPKSDLDLVVIVSSDTLSQVVFQFSQVLN